MHLPFKIIYNLENYLLKSFTMFATCMCVCVCVCACMCVCVRACVCVWRLCIGGPKPFSLWLCWSIHAARGSIKTKTKMTKTKSQKEKKKFREKKKQWFISQSMKYGSWGYIECVFINARLTLVQYPNNQISEMNELLLSGSKISSFSLKSKRN